MNANYYKVFQIVPRNEPFDQEELAAKHAAIFEEELTTKHAEQYSLVAIVEANSLEHVFELMNLWNEPSKVTKLNERCTSLSVGDLVVENNYTLNRVARFGFDEVTNEDVASMYRFGLMNEALSDLQNRNFLKEIE